MSKLKRVPDYIMLCLMFILSFSRTTLAKIFPAARPAPRASVKVFDLPQQTWACLRAGEAFQDGKDATTKSGDKKDEPASGKQDAQPAEKKDDGAKKTEPAPAGNSGDSAQGGTQQPPKAPEPQGPGGGDGDIPGVGG